MPTRRLIRRQPLLERIKAYLNPLDFLLSLSEQLDSSDWDQWLREWATPIGVALNVVMLTARANSGHSYQDVDDIFGDEQGGTTWAQWFATFLVQFLTLLSALNALYTFRRKRHYRLFEAPISAPLATPSAHRVRVDSSPLSSSPLRFLSSLLSSDASAAASARAHPDANRDVWELSVWDPLPICTRTFVLFSPGHALLYISFLPTTAATRFPSLSIATTIMLAALLTLQLSLLQSSFTQQAKDSAVIHKEVLHEYDTKFVHPRTQPVVRDVGTQFSPSIRHAGDEVETYTPFTLVNRGWKTNPNPAYLNHVDPDGTLPRDTPSRAPAETPMFRTPMAYAEKESPLARQTALRHAGASKRTSLGPSMAGNGLDAGAQGNLRQRASMGSELREAGRATGVGAPMYNALSANYAATAAASAGDGGSLGAYSHAQSPLKKKASLGLMRGAREPGRERGRETSPQKRASGAPGPGPVWSSDRTPGGRWM